MIMIRKLFLFLVVAIILYYLGLSAFSLEKTSNRSNSEYPLSKELKERIKYESSTYYEFSPIELSLGITGSLLEFSEKNNIKNGKANCVGYAQLFTSIYNYALSIDGLDGRAKPVVGNIKWCGINICNVLKAIVPKKYEDFVKDHDFVELEFEDNYVYIDPTLYDFCGRTGRTTCPKN